MVIVSGWLAAYHIFCGTSTENSNANNVTAEETMILLL
jgi:hypothetical protein